MAVSSFASLKIDMSGLLMANEIIVTNVTNGVSNGVSCTYVRKERKSAYL